MNTALLFREGFARQVMEKGWASQGSHGRQKWASPHDLHALGSHSKSAHREGKPLSDLQPQGCGTALLVFLSVLPCVFGAWYIVDAQ